MTSTYIDFDAPIAGSANVLTIVVWAAVLAAPVVSPGYGGMFVGFHQYDVWFYNGCVGFNTGVNEALGISAADVNQINMFNYWAQYVFVMCVGSVNSNSMYINSISQEPLSLVIGTASAPNNALFNNGNGRISGVRSTNLFNGKIPMNIGAFQIYSGALSPMEVRNDYMNFVMRYYPASLILYYDAENPASWSGGSIIRDLTANGYDGTLSQSLSGSATYLRHPALKLNPVYIDFNAAIAGSASALTVVFGAAVSVPASGGGF
jgi:hypothetical protein